MFFPLIWLPDDVGRRLGAIYAVMPRQRWATSAGAACGFYGKIDPSNLQESPMLIDWASDLARAIRSHDKMVKTERDKLAR